MTKQIITYKQEHLDGIAEKIKRDSSILCASKIEAWKPNVEEYKSIANSSNFSSYVQRVLRDNKIDIEDEDEDEDEFEESKKKKYIKRVFDDLYYVQSILVSSNWNANDDVFVPEEIWVARETPIGKPTNLGHDETQIIGHMISTWAIDEKGNTIADNIEIHDLPNLYHIVNGSVIYTQWMDKEIDAKVKQLISEIEAGMQYVSMECKFNNFDYAIMSAEGEYYQLPRREETAFLSKHLRYYGGTGEYQNYRVGRLLRDITFKGKGFTSKPANSYSIIFSNKHDVLSMATTNIPIFSKKGVYTITNVSDNNSLLNRAASNQFTVAKEEMNNMANESELINELKTSNAKLTDELTQLKNSVAKTQVDNLIAQIEKLNEDLASAKCDDSEKEKMMKEKDAKCSELTSNLNVLQEEHNKLVASHEELSKTLAEMQKKNLLTARVASLVDAGIAKDIAEKKVEIYASLTDEQFDSVKNDMQQAYSKKDGKDTKKDESCSTQVASSVIPDDEIDNGSDASLDDAEAVKDLALATAGNLTEAVTSARKSLSEFFASKFNVKLNNE